MPTKHSFTSPQAVYDDPKSWLNTPHNLHEAMNKLMIMIFPDWEQHLKDAKVHCILCEGHKPVPVITRDTLECKYLTGYVGDPGSEDMLYMLKDKDDVEKMEADAHKEDDNGRDTLTAG